MTKRDRLDRILDTDETDLGSHYDQWAATYDDDHDGWEWRGPELIAAAILRLGTLGTGGAIYDAGCGTGRAGTALRRAGWTGTVVGLDVSSGMLDVAAGTGAYDQLIRCSLYDLPLVDDVAGAVLSSGVFTHGHVSGAALAELVRVTAPGGLVSLTKRLDVDAELHEHEQALTATGGWQLVEQTPPLALHPGRDETPQTISTWQVSG